MSEQNGRKLQDLSKAELIEKVKTAREIWKTDQTTIESLTDQVGKAADDIKKLNAGIEEKDAQIESLREKLEELCTQIALAYRQVQTAKEALKPYYKSQPNDGQHQSDPSE